MVKTDAIEGVPMSCIASHYDLFADVLVYPSSVR